MPAKIVTITAVVLVVIVGSVSAVALASGKNPLTLFAQRPAAGTSTGAGGPTTLFSPTPIPTATATPAPTATPLPPTLVVNPTSLNAGAHIGQCDPCTITLSSPGSNALRINWQATITITHPFGGGSPPFASINPPNGTLAPGHQLDVMLSFSSDLCGRGVGTVTFTGGVHPVVVQWTGDFGAC